MVDVLTLVDGVFPDDSQSTRSARIVSATEKAGVGALVQVIGFILLFLFPILTLAGIILLFWGQAMRKIHRCSECAEKVQPEAKVCAHCGARFWV